MLRMRLPVTIVASVFALLVALPSTAFANRPAVSTKAVYATGATTDNVLGAIRTASQASEFHVVYGLASSTWCTSSGSSGSPEHSTSTQTLYFSGGEGFYFAEASLSGLTARTAYCEQLVANSASASETGGQVVFTAGLPSISMYPKRPTGATTEEVSGEINLAGQTTEYHVAYSLAGSTWCTSRGNSGSPENTTPPQTLSSTEAHWHIVEVSFSGLTSGTEYCVEVIASNASGTGSGGQTTFTAGAPAVNLGSTEATGATTEEVSGDVEGTAGQTTGYHVAYGLANSTWCTSRGNSGSPENTTPPQTLSSTEAFGGGVFDLSGLTPSATYCVEVIASNASGTGSGGQTAFTAGAPWVFAGPRPVLVTGATTEEVSGEINTARQTTEYHVAYGLANSTWCTSEGSSGSPESTTSPQTLDVTDANRREVSIGLSGLTPGAAYCEDVIASNASGTMTSAADGEGYETFTAGTPEARTYVSQHIGPTIPGEVNPEDQTTEYHVIYGLGSSTWCTSEGSSGSPEYTTSPQTLGFSDAHWHNVSVSLSGLTGGTEYCAELVASNASATRGGGQMTFTTDRTPPVVTTDPATSIAPNGATVNGTINPNGQAAAYYFEYGTTSAYGSFTTSANAGSGSSPQPVSFGLGGLMPSTSYHYRLVASTAFGTTDGSDQTFTTSTSPLTPPSTGPTGTLPAVGDLTVAPSSFAAAPSGPSASTAAKHKTGASVTYKLNEATIVTFTVRQSKPGRVGKDGRCVKQTSKNRHARKCTLTVILAGSFSRTGVAGSSKFHFSGRLAGHRLKPGYYLLVATPKSDRKSATADFQIVR